MSDANEVKFSLKVMIDKQKNKVLFAEADSDFTDVLLSFLTLPLGRILKVLEGHNGDKARAIGSLTTLYRGLFSLNHFYFGGCNKYQLLNPCKSSGVKLKLTVDYPQPRKDLISEDTYCRKKSKTSRYASTVFRTPVANDGDKDVGFTIESASFMITDDLQVAPVVPGSVLQTLLNLGITETNEVELRTLTLGYNEIVDLLEGSLISSTPLTDLIFPERGQMDFVTKKLLPKASKEESSSSSMKMTVKAMIQKSTNMILFVEAKEDFVGFLFGFFFIPLGGVGCLLGGNTCLNNIDSLSRSISNLDGDKYLKTKDTKAMLLKPQISEIYNYDHFFPFAEKGLSTSKSARTYVEQEQVMYNVTDDLTVTPFCMTSSFSILSRLKIPLSDIDEVDLEIGLDEGLRILKASLTSTTALTDGLVNSIAKKQPKQER
ncbi:hypothetical protein OROHE_012746 [Orobanche hederae]